MARDFLVFTSVSSFLTKGGLLFVKTVSLLVPSEASSSYRVTIVLYDNVTIYSASSSIIGFSTVNVKLTEFKLFV
jgi:hypothetical protein